MHFLFPAGERIESMALILSRAALHELLGPERPPALLRDYRLTLAQRLLTEEKLAIKQVAHRLGYANVHNFTHAFTARFGIPPGAMRGRGKNPTGSK